MYEFQTIILLHEYKKIIPFIFIVKVHVCLIDTLFDVVVRLLNGKYIRKKN